MSRFLRALQSGQVLLMDGAMGTELLRAGARPGECLEAWNVNHPEKVRSIHDAYVKAGAQVLLTNTFQANLGNLERHGLRDRMDAILQAGVSLAREAAGPDIFVLGDIGPASNPACPRRHPDPDAVPHTLPGLQAADGILLETWSDPGALVAAQRCRALLDSEEKPLLLSLTYRRDETGRLCTKSGHEPEVFAEQAQKHGAAALGANCGREVDMKDMVEIICRYRSATDLPLFARPNAGTPRRAGEGWEYPYTPGQMAEMLPALLDEGVGMIGGCCGTTPEHIASFRCNLDKRVLDQRNLAR